jgi:hypothetical protein
MSTSSPPPDEDKQSEVTISPDEGASRDATKPLRKRKPRSAAKPQEKEKPDEVAILEETPGEVVIPLEEESPPEAATPQAEEASSEGVILTEEEILSEVVIPPEEGTSPAAESTLGEEASLDNEHASVEVKPRDAAYWAQQASTLRVSHVPTGALNLNVEGRLAVGPLQGFGRMWQKTYRVSLKGASVQPLEVIKTWKEHFPRFWPKGNYFYQPLVGIAPGEVALISLSMGVRLSTGVMVLYADEESFTLMTPVGHPFSAWITFSAYKEDECTVVQIQALLRPSDPIYELLFSLGASKKEDSFWQQTIKALATHFEVLEPKVETKAVCLDPKLQWSQTGNIWHNAGARTVIYRMLTPVHWVFKRVSR